VQVKKYERERTKNEEKRTFWFITTMTEKEREGEGFINLE
jgi:hypothetical protein